MPGVARVNVGCALADQSALEQITHAIRQEGCRPIALPRSDVLAATAEGALDALVYDLQPADSAAVTFVRQVRAARPDWPVWIYYPPRGRFPERAAEVGSLRWVWTSPQLPGALGELEIPAHVRAIVAAVPRLQFARILDGLLRPIPAEVREFLTGSIEGLGGPGGPCPGNTDARQGIGESEAEVRWLERICQAAELPGPKRLRDDATLAFLTFQPLAFGLPLLPAAQRAGLARKDVDRLFVRALGSSFHWASLEPRAQFEFAVMALATTCHVGEREAQQMVRQVVREHVG